MLPDFSKPFTIDADASDNAVGAGLLQHGNDGKLYSVVYMLHKYSPQERNYSVPDRELLAIFVACQKWRCYIDG